MVPIIGVEPTTFALRMRRYYIFTPFKNLLLKQVIHYKTLCYEKHLLIKIDRC